jgi:hypothetical protein
MNTNIHRSIKFTFTIYMFKLLPKALKMTDLCKQIKINQSSIF